MPVSRHPQFLNGSRPWLGYGLAVVTTAAALLITLAVSGSGERPFLMLFLAAGIVTSWFAGEGPGLFSILLGGILSIRLFGLSIVFVVGSMGNRLALLVYLVLGGVLVHVVSRQRRAGLLQSALYRIADQTTSVASLDEFYRAVHEIVGQLMPARNFYIAIYDRKQDLLVFPYSVDERQPERPPRPLRRGMTEYVLRTHQPLLTTPQVSEQLSASGEVQRSGAPARNWLGVPLTRGGETFGVLAVQSYTHKVRYTEQHKLILTFVSRQVASAIQHKRDEAELKQSEARHKALVDQAALGIYRSTLDGRFLDVNPALARMLGYESVDDLYKLNLKTDIFVDVQDREHLIATNERTGKIQTAEVRWKRKDGTPIMVKLSGTRVEDDRCDVAFEVLAENVTERHALEEQFRQAQKMEAVGRLAGGVAHDFNNLLMVISGYTELLTDDHASKELTLKTVAEIKKACGRATELIRQLLAFSRKQVLEPQVLDLNAVIGQLQNLLHRLLGEDVAIVTHLAPGLGRAKVDRSQLEQILMNLAVNARDAMANGGKLVIETANVELTEDYAEQHMGCLPGPYVQLTISDTGCGMDAATRAQIFEPFFTTKARGKGTGLGLSTVYGVVKQSRGYITVDSEPGTGTSFKIYLPRADAEASAAPRPERRSAPQGTETILLVEDEAGVREVAEQFLLKQGYKVLQAPNGLEALAVSQRHPGPIHLLITDVIMPGMNGRQLAQQLSSARPDIKVLYISGYTDDIILHHGVLESDSSFLQKPFGPEALIGKVRETLATAKSASVA